MKTVFLILAMAWWSGAQASEWTTLVATEGAMVTLEKATPAPPPAPDAGSTYEGKLTVDVRVPATPPAVTAPNRSCRNGLCPLQSRESTPPADNPQKSSIPGEACAGGVCDTAPFTKGETLLRRRVVDAASGCHRQTYSDPATTRTRWRLFRR